MKFTLVTLSLAVLSLAAPVPKAEPLSHLSSYTQPIAISRRQGAVFSPTPYDQLSISGGVAGNAEAEALAKLDKLPSNLSNAVKADLDFLNDVNQVANEVETKVFNPAIEAASGAAKAALQRGKTKNKVLKLQATILKLQAQAAQGKDVSAKLAQEQTKLANNIRADVAAAGEASTAVRFNKVVGA